MIASVLSAVKIERATTYWRLCEFGMSAASNIAHRFYNEGLAPLPIQFSFPMSLYSVRLVSKYTIVSCTKIPSQSGIYYSTLVSRYISSPSRINHWSLVSFKLQHIKYPFQGATFKRVSICGYLGAVGGVDWAGLQPRFQSHLLRSPPRI
jgi:hypothetical protein